MKNLFESRRNFLRQLITTSVALVTGVPASKDEFVPDLDVNLIYPARLIDANIPRWCRMIIEPDFDGNPVVKYFGSDSDFVDITDVEWTEIQDPEALGISYESKCEIFEADIAIRTDPRLVELFDKPVDVFESDEVLITFGNDNEETSSSRPEPDTDSRVTGQPNRIEYNDQDTV